jgi:hypothetical protein
MSLRKGKIHGITPPPPPPPAGMYAWGSGYYGELGVGDTFGRSDPAQVGSATDWTVADALSGNGYGLRSGKLYAWGPNDYGQIGDGTADWVHRIPALSRLAPRLIGRRCLVVPVTLPALSELAGFTCGDTTVTVR